ncbi:MAG: anaerobic ribonucleoside-triphosphate reductase activating protein [Candidatus Sumerlaeia bacterium]
MKSMRIAGLQKCSLVDYPGEMAAVVFTPGCNMNCFFCHNKGIVTPGAHQFLVDPDEALDTIRKRSRMRGAVVISGGEPTLQPGLEDFIIQLREMDLKVKLDTNGTKPEVLSRLIRKGLIDFVSMDLKAPRDRYEEICGAQLDMDDIDTSIEILKQGYVDYEFRTTVVPQLDGKDLQEMARWIHGARSWILQQYRPLGRELWNDDERCAVPPHSPDFIRGWAWNLRSYVEELRMRGLGVDKPEPVFDAPSYEQPEMDDDMLAAYEEKDAENSSLA